MFKISKRKGSSLWQVRKRWPTDVAPILKGEFTRSTGESDRKLAEAKLPIISAEYVALVEDARRRLADNRFRDLSEVEIRRLATEFYTEALRHYQIRGPLDRTQRDKLLKSTVETIETLEDHLARRDPTPVATLTRNMVERKGLPIPEDSGSLAHLAMMNLRAMIELHRGVAARLRGVDDYRPADSNIANLVNEAGKPSRTVNDLIDAFEEAESERWAPSTVRAKEPVNRLLRETIGERPAAEIGRTEAREIVTLLRRLPAGLGKLKQLRGLNVKQAADRGEKLGLPTIAPATVNRAYLAHISALFNWAHQEEWTTTNPFRGLMINDPVAPEDKRDPFTSAQLKTIFSAKPWTRPGGEGEKPIRFWGPLIALFLGMRRGEIAQLHTADIEEVDGIPAIRVRPGGSKRLKTRNARRTLPVHPELIRMGFLGYVERRRKEGGELLFAGEEPDIAGKWGDSLGDWFGRRLKELGVTGNRLGLHSFRHNFQDRLRAAGLHNSDIGQEIVGRTKRAGSSDQYGGAGYPMGMLLEAVSRVAYPDLDLSHLHRGEERKAA